MATVATLSDDVAVYGQSLLAANGQILLAAHKGPTEGVIVDIDVRSICELKALLGCPTIDSGTQLSVCMTLR